MELNTVHFYHIKDIEKEALKHKISFINDFSLYLLGLFLLYDTLIIALFSFQNYELINNTLGNAISIVAYLLLLSILYIIVARFKKHGFRKNFMNFFKNNENTEIETIFNIGLLLNSLFLILLSIFESEEIYSAVGLVSFSLYLGFATSISDILEQKSLVKFLLCFFNPLKKIGLNKHNFYRIFYVIIPIVLLASNTYKWLIYKWLIGTLIGICIAFIVLCRLCQSSQSSYIKSILFDVSDKNVLIMQIGENLALQGMVESMIKNLNLELDIKETENLLSNLYDTIIILSPGIKKQELLRYMPFIKNKINDNGCIIDPLMKNGKRRPFVLGFLGITFFKTTRYSIYDYINLFE